MQRSAEALDILEKALDRHPYDRNILYSLATISAENGLYEQALFYARKLVEYYPQDASYQQLLVALSG
jgi:tetratricopeptide (TPR) repeat protein